MGIRRYNNYFAILRDMLGMISPEDILPFVDLIWQAKDAGRQIFICGNGGSAATASHLAEDLTKGVLCKPRIKAISLCDSAPLLTALANDGSYSCVFREQLIPFMQAGDLLICFSGSGNSENIYRAIDYANNERAVTIAFGGCHGGRMGKIAQHKYIIPSDNMQIIEDCHMAIVHALYYYLNERAKNAA